jgi:hypothetical protein
MQPGRTERPLTVFEPGTYDLEVRVPGFPGFTQEVVIESGKFTHVTVMLHGVR